MRRYLGRPKHRAYALPSRSLVGIGRRLLPMRCPDLATRLKNDMRVIESAPRQQLKRT